MHRSPHRTLLSVHVPKSSGVSLRTAFAQAVGPRRLLLDYAHDPVDPATPPAPIVAQRCAPNLSRLRHVRVVHGHFPIQKYDAWDDACRAVMLREPVDNLISIYFFWQHLIESGHLEGHALFRSFYAERPSLIEFARFPTFRYLLSRTFFGGYDMRRFTIIGDFCERGSYFAALSRHMGRTLDTALHANRTPHSPQRDEALHSAHVGRTLRDLLREDIDFYERWSSHQTARPGQTGTLGDSA